MDFSGIRSGFIYGASIKLLEKVKKCFARLISERAPEAAAHSELGQWEGDTMLLSARIV